MKTCLLFVVSVAYLCSNVMAKSSRRTFLDNVEKNCDLIFKKDTAEGNSGLTVCLYEGMGVLDKNGILHRQKFIDIVGWKYGDLAAKQFDKCIGDYVEGTESLAERLTKFNDCVNTL